MAEGGRTRIAGSTGSGPEVGGVAGGEMCGSRESCRYRTPSRRRGKPGVRGDDGPDAARWPGRCGRTRPGAGRGPCRPGSVALWSRSARSVSSRRALFKSGGHQGPRATGRTTLEEMYGLLRFCYISVPAVRRWVLLPDRQTTPTTSLTLVGAPNRPRLLLLRLQPPRGEIAPFLHRHGGSRESWGTAMTADLGRTQGFVRSSTHSKVSRAWDVVRTLVLPRVLAITIMTVCLQTSWASPIGVILARPRGLCDRHRLLPAPSSTSSWRTMTAPRSSGGTIIKTTLIGLFHRHRLLPRRASTQKEAPRVSGVAVNQAVVLLFSRRCGSSTSSSTPSLLGLKPRHADQTDEKGRAVTVVADRNSEPETPDPGAGRGALGSYGDEPVAHYRRGRGGPFPRSIPSVPCRGSGTICRKSSGRSGFSFLSSYGIILFMEGILAAEISLEGHYLLKQLGAGSYTALVRRGFSDYTGGSRDVGFGCSPRRSVAALVAEIGSMRISRGRSTRWRSWGLDSMS